MALTLAATINATQNRVTLSEALDADPGDLFRIDNEVVRFGGYGRRAGNQRLVDHTQKVVSFSRGEMGTTPASHTATTAVLRVADGLVSAVGTPDPFVSGGGGGAVDSVNGQTGVVVLVADDVSADPAGSASAAAATVVDGAPAGLNTLAKIAASIANDEDFEGSMQTALATKQPLDPFLTDLSGYANFTALVDALKPYFLEPD